jgi:hypothetical protein
MDLCCFGRNFICVQMFEIAILLGLMSWKLLRCNWRIVNWQTKKQWRVPRGEGKGAPAPRAIMPGDSGIFATCNKGREPKCVGELRDLFSEYAEQLYGDGADEDEGNGAEGIENDIKAELAGIQKPPTAQLFVPVKLDVQCGELERAEFAFTFRL